MATVASALGQFDRYQQLARAYQECDSRCEQSLAELDYVEACNRELRQWACNAEHLFPSFLITPAHEKARPLVR